MTSQKTMTKPNDCSTVGQGLLQLLTKAETLLAQESFVNNTSDEYFYAVMERAVRLGNLCAEVLKTRQEQSPQAVAE